MANITIDTAAPGYQQRLTQLREIKSFYGPRIVQYLEAPRERQQAWRSRDPILWEMLDIWHKIDQRTDDSID